MTSQSGNPNRGHIIIYVVALAIEHFPALRLDELWVTFGIGTHFRQIAIHEIVKNVNQKE